MGKKDKGSRRAKKSGGAHGQLLRRQLTLLGLEEKEVAADGNCFFRSLADQLHGDESRHAEVRMQIMEHVEDQGCVCSTACPCCPLTRLAFDGELCPLSMEKSIPLL